MAGERYRHWESDAARRPSASSAGCASPRPAMRAGCAPRSRPRACNRPAPHRPAGRVAAVTPRAAGLLGARRPTDAARRPKSRSVGLLCGDDLESDGVPGRRRQAEDLRLEVAGSEGRALSCESDRLELGSEESHGAVVASAVHVRAWIVGRPTDGFVPDTRFLAIRLHFVNCPLIADTPSASILETRRWLGAS